MLEAELAKIRYARATWVIGGIAILLYIAACAVIIATPHLIPLLINLNKTIPNATDAQNFTPAQLDLLSITHPTAQWNLADFTGASMNVTGVGSVAAMLFGALFVAAEFRYGSITTALLLTPRRWRVVVGKAVAVALSAAAFSALAALVSLMALRIGLAVTPNSALRVGDGPLLLEWLSGGACIVLFALIGVGLGLVLRSQVVVVALVFVLAIVEGIAHPLASYVFGGVNAISFLPFGLGYDVMAKGNILLGQKYAGFEPGTALALLALWALCLVGAGGFSLARRDVPSDA